MGSCSWSCCMHVHWAIMTHMWRKRMQSGSFRALSCISMYMYTVCCSSGQGSAGHAQGVRPGMGGRPTQQAALLLHIRRLHQEAPAGDRRSRAGRGQWEVADVSAGQDRARDEQQDDAAGRLLQWENVSATGLVCVTIYSPRMFTFNSLLYVDTW